MNEQTAGDRARLALMAGAGNMTVGAMGSEALDFVGSVTMSAGSPGVDVYDKLSTKRVARAHSTSHSGASLKVRSG